MKTSEILLAVRPTLWNGHRPRPPQTESDPYTALRVYAFGLTGEARRKALEVAYSLLNATPNTLRVWCVWTYPDVFAMPNFGVGEQVDYAAQDVFVQSVAIAWLDLLVAAYQTQGD